MIIEKSDVHGRDCPSSLRQTLKTSFAEMHDTLYIRRSGSQENIFVIS